MCGITPTTPYQGLRPDDPNLHRRRRRETPSIPLPRQGYALRAALTGEPMPERSAPGDARRPATAAHPTRGGQDHLH